MPASDAINASCKVRLLYCFLRPTPSFCRPSVAGHNYIGTEHILLGLLREGEGVAARVLETLGADQQKIRSQARSDFVNIDAVVDSLGSRLCSNPQ